jgi:molybdenum cofactor cytidylyltransferase
MIPAIILAAGASSRMGRPKALLPIDVDGTTFLERLVKTLREAGVDDVIVVVGHDANRVREVVDDAGLAVRTVENPDPARGQLSSLITALEIADRPGVEAVLVAPVDQPLVTVGTVRCVVDAYRRTRAPVVRPAHEGRHGHPAILDRSLFDEIRRADLAAGARGVIKAHQAEAVDVAVDDEGAFLDIDTPEEYERLFRDRARGGDQR